MNLTQGLNTTLQNFTNGNYTQDLNNTFQNFTNGDDMDLAYNLPRVLGVVVYLGFGSFAYLANIIVLILILCYRKGSSQRTIFDITVCSLVVADLLASFGIVTGFPFLLLADPDTVPLWAIQMIAVFKRTSVICFLSSVLHIVVITAERFFGLFAPFVYRRVVTKSKLLILLAIIWVLTAGLAIISCVSSKDILETSYTQGVVLLASGLACSIMYVMIGIKVLVLRRQNKRTSRRDSRILENAFAVTLSLLVCTFPSALKPFVMDYDEMRTYGFLCDSLFAVKILLDPILYYFMIYYYGVKSGLTPRGSARGSAG